MNCPATHGDLKEYILDRVGLGPAWNGTPCWLSKLMPTDRGYCQMTIGGSRYYMHRLAYETWIGPIPDGLVIDHLCRVRHCCNPCHLEPVTERENLLRGRSFSAINAMKTHCIHGHEFTPENTRFRPTGGRACRSCERTRREVARARKRPHDGTQWDQHGIRQARGNNPYRSEK